MKLTEDQLRELLQTALGALADIAFSDDLTLVVARKKARRVYEEISPQVEAENETS